MIGNIYLLLLWSFIFFYIYLGTLEALSIPPLDLNQNIDRSEMGSGDRLSNSPSLRVSPQPNNATIEGFGDQSNSEDSSLSDSDRTLVGDAPG